MNGDGAFQAGEGLAGVDVILTGDLDGDGAAETIRTATVAGGTYSFVGLPAGTFQVTVDTADIVPAGLLAWVDPDGTRDSTTQVTVTAGQSSTTTDFGYVAPASLSGVVFNDISGNGSQGAGELGTSGVTVYLDLNLNGALDLGESTQVTIRGSAMPSVGPFSVARMAKQTHGYSLRTSWQQRQFRVDLSLGRAWLIHTPCLGFSGRAILSLRSRFLRYPRNFVEFGFAVGTFSCLNRHSRYNIIGSNPGRD